jgi:ADP-heptose:LPS heptosyltransferase
MDVWKRCKNLLVIRADNMGDVLMSSPAIKALKSFTGARITLLTSLKGSEVGRLNPDVDEVIAIDLPWIKTDSISDGHQVLELAELLKRYQFDGCVIFTVYSQNPLPAAMLAYMAEIRLRLAYCRENPYGLLSNWIPDEEPYTIIRHQVQRDLDLVASLGALTEELLLQMSLPAETGSRVAKKLRRLGFEVDRPYLVLHPGVSERKREYPLENWVACGKKLLRDFNMPLLLTGSETEADILTALKNAIGAGAHISEGLSDLAEFAFVLKKARAIVSVNTGTVHLAAAIQTPVVVLYAQTNPQHTPWMVPHVVLQYSVSESMKSRNEVIKFVDRKLYQEHVPLPDEYQIAAAIGDLLSLSRLAY